MPWPPAQEDRDADRRGQGLRDQGCHGRALHAQRRNRSPAEDEQRIEQEIQNHRAEHDHHRHTGLADAAHQRLEHRIDEHEDDADEGHAHEPERTVIDVRRNPQQPQQEGCQRVADGAEDDRGDGDHHHGLRGHVIDHVLPPGAHVLRAQGRPGHGQPGAERNHQERHRKTHRNRRHGRRAQPPDPERIGQLIAGLQHIPENDRNGQRHQRARDRALEEQRAAAGKFGRWGHGAIGLRNGEDQPAGAADRCVIVAVAASFSARRLR